MVVYLTLVFTSAIYLYLVEFFVRIATRTLRKTVATLMFYAGCDEHVIERLLRRPKRDVTSLYVGMVTANLQKYLETYSPIRLIMNGSRPESNIVQNSII